VPPDWSIIEQQIVQPTPPVMSCQKRSITMKHVSTSCEVTTPTLQDVLDNIAAGPDIAHNRKRDLRSAMPSFGKPVRDAGRPRG
jgi:hypothetical protein